MVGACSARLVPALGGVAAFRHVVFPDDVEGAVDDLGVDDEAVEDGADDLA